MNKLRKLSLKFAGLLASLALVVGVTSTQATLCVIMFHQPKVPQGMEKYMKRK